MALSFRPCASAGYSCRESLFAFPLDDFGEEQRDNRRIGDKLSTKLESQSKAVAVIVLVVAVADVETCPGESPRALP